MLRSGIQLKIYLTKSTAHIEVTSPTITGAELIKTLVLFGQYATLLNHTLAFSSLVQKEGAIFLTRLIFETGIVFLFRCPSLGVADKVSRDTSPSRISEPGFELSLIGYFPESFSFRWSQSQLLNPKCS